MGLALLPRAQLTVGLGSVWVTSSVPLDVKGVLTHTPGNPRTARGLHGAAGWGQNQADATCLSELGIFPCGKTLVSGWTEKEDVGGHTEVIAGQELTLGWMRPACTWQMNQLHPRSADVQFVRGLSILASCS